MTSDERDPLEPRDDRADDIGPDANPRADDDPLLPLGHPDAPLQPGERLADDDLPVPHPGYPPPIGEGRHLDDAELASSLAATLADWRAHAPNGEFWLFAYGSLIWKPEVSIAERVDGRIHGYHRGLYLWSRVNRGTGTRPGLVLALDRGGSCPGVAMRVAPERIDEELPALWRREMAMGSYRPAWLPCRLADGRRLAALTFVIRRDVPAYAGKLNDALVRQVFACASGRYGTTLDYVARTCDALRESGMPDFGLEARLRRCRPK
ncbi:gamma-glutamylcyclotransferase [Chitinasiproducens palmae]|uniref:glutathione-specific gamma-glutamylcyclotransferase n=1 Tax=Chitinasiproducens palmae TaxID=1770053 RepID=A0A1H2PN47_9BURK|nr:gamma-glutamylcyclotransferase [Chitinasiproducens palmae]SDV48091.1 cation transport protein ChaC [Chitinasiproducens palmae]